MPQLLTSPSRVWPANSLKAIVAKVTSSNYKKSSEQRLLTRHTEHTYFNKTHWSITLLPEAELAVSRTLGEQLPETFLENGRWRSAWGR